MVDRFRELGTATVYEAGGATGLVDVELVQLLPESRAAGSARTVLCAPGDNLGVHQVMETVLEGEVIVIGSADPRPVALVGELLAIQAKERGAAALLVDGAVRDVEAIRAFGLPVWCRWVRAAGALKQKPGTLGAGIEMGGTRIADGDVLVLDTDGVVAVPHEDVVQWLEASEAREQKEDAIREHLASGELTLDLLDLRGVASK